MSRIAIADNCGMKFCRDVYDHWIAQGHEVRYERGASEVLAQWADVYYVEWIDGNLDYLWKIYNGAEGVSRTPDWDNNKKPKIICRAIDWDIWCENIPYWDQKYLDFVDQWIFIAPHMQKRFMERADDISNVNLIRPGVNLDKFTLKTKVTDGYQLGMVLGDMWWPKNHMGGLDIFATLFKKDPRWRLHIRGQHEPGQFWPVMYEHYLDSRGIREAVTLYPHQDDMNLWYENIDVLLHPGMKEAFCYAVGEAMAKGIKPVINNFYGAIDIWDGEYLYNTHQQAVNMLQNSGNPAKPNKDYRAYIENYHNVKTMLGKYDDLI